MKERPILFSASMIRAILAGRKTQTRRALRMPPGYAMGELLDGSPWPRYQAHADGDEESPWLPCPYGRPMDKLWVRETWGVSYLFDHIKPAWLNPDLDVYYRATDSVPGEQKWRPSIFMPFWASRLELLVLGVRAEQLQLISEADAKAEGVSECDEFGHDDCFYGSTAYRCAFEKFWGAINGETGPQSWTANPWVWVVEFERIGGSK